MKRSTSDEMVPSSAVRPTAAGTRRRPSPPRFPELEPQLEHFDGGNPDWERDRQYVIRERKLISRSVVAAAISLPIVFLVAGIIAGLSSLALALVVAVALGPLLVLVRRVADLLF